MRENLKDIITVFATYGFRKTSMADIAKAAGISRQSLYKKFASKEDVFDWVVKTFGENVYAHAVELFEDMSHPTETILSVFDVWTGVHIDMLRTMPHGTEILDLAISSGQKTEENSETKFYNKLNFYLLESGLAKSQTHAEELGFVLKAAAKGLLMISPSRAVFSTDMKRIVNTLMNEPSCK